MGALLGVAGVWLCLESADKSQRKEEKTVFDLRAVKFVLLGAFLFYVVVFHYLANLPLDTKPLFVSVQMRFWMQGFVLFALFIGVGYHLLFQKYPRFQSVKAPAMVLLLLLQLAVTLPKVLPVTAQNNYLEAYGRAQLAAVAPGGLYVVHGDSQQNAALYLKQCLGEFPAVDVLYLPYASYMWFNATQLPLYRDVVWPGTVYHPLGSVLKGEGGNAFTLRGVQDWTLRRSELLRANLPRRRVFINAWYTGKDEPKDFALWPLGLINEVGVAQALNPR